MKHLFLIIALLFCVQTFAQKQDKDKAAILNVLNEQKEAWNRNDLEGFMAGYWHSEELKFFGASGVTSGTKHWQITKKDIPDRNIQVIWNSRSMKCLKLMMMPIMSWVNSF